MRSSTISTRRHLGDEQSSLWMHYNGEVDRYRRAGGKGSIDDFVRYEKIKWSETLKANLERRRYAEFDESQVRSTLYRPFTRRVLCFNEVLIERRYLFSAVFPAGAEQSRESCDRPDVAGL